MPESNCTCEVCGTRFHRYPAWIKRGGGTCCSIQCRNVRARSVQDQTGEANPAYQHGRGRAPERLRAWRAVNKAVARGTLQKQPCQQCGSSNDIHAHHDNYASPLDVRWLCRDCHDAFHHRQRTG